MFHKEVCFAATAATVFALTYNNIRHIYCAQSLPSRMPVVAKCSTMRCPATSIRTHLHLAQHVDQPALRGRQLCCFLGSDCRTSDRCFPRPSSSNLPSLTRRFLFNVTVTHLQDKCQIEHQGSCLWTAHIPVLHATHAG